MKNLQTLDVASNPLIIPPGPEVNKGTEAMLFWLRDNEDTLMKGAKVSGLGLQQ